MKYLPIFILIFVVLACRPSTGSRTAPPMLPPESRTPSFTPTIDYTKPRWENLSENFQKLNIEVKNTSDRPLEFLKMEVSSYDGNDGFLTSDDIYIERWERFLPGDRSPSTMMIRPDPRSKHVRIRFTCRVAGSTQTLDVIANEVSKIK